ncbi:glyoxalase [Xanthomonas euroxanthea]|uniref:Glyoxalase n=1 Tax=Xanthomonas euroxanthea TaxID=2259622 RepID=A0A8E4GEL7_9XANT|nr:VOC family protein [Xanthomonas euroxanthea]CAD1792157.1 glyoxalase [Xanthomonas euroxanthea]SYZ55762.1 glyoxalase [Xanthomonas arboricola pv. juglandis]
MIQPVKYKRIDHLALAVRDLDAAVKLFVDVLGFELVAQRTITGKRTGMISAEVVHNDITFVLCQGTGPDSQVSRLIDGYGPGVAHIALAVDDTEGTMAELKDKGVPFDTSVIKGPGLTQTFTSRDPNTGMSFELIQRSGEAGFLDDNINELFSQLEESGSY